MTQAEHVPATGPGTYARWSETSGYQFCSCGQWHFESRPTPTDTEGSEGYGCACADRDSVQCAAIRYGMDHFGEPCECLCHQWDDQDDDY